MAARPLTITRIEAVDVRFPTARDHDGSDAMNPDPDYSAAYLVLHTEDAELQGHGFAFTIGEGTDICVAAIRTLGAHIVGTSIEDAFADMGAFSRRLTGISHLRWLGPEKGVMHLATSAVLNAVWDLFAKARGLPLWRLVAGMTPEELVSLVDFRYLTDVLTPDQALDILRDGRAGSRRSHRAARGDRLSRVHHLRGLAGLRRRQGAAPVPGGARRWLHALQAQGGPKRGG